MAKRLSGVTKLSKSTNTLVTRWTKPSPGLIAILIAIGVAGRLLPHLPNVTPIGGIAIWSGVRVERPWNFVVVLTTMFVSDIFLGAHSTMLYVYGSLALITWLASLMKRVNIMNVLAVTLVSAGLFFIITNFGVWKTSTLYPPTVAGLVQAYVAALPFLRASLLGDLVYTALFFSLEYAVLTRISKQRIVKNVA